MIPNCFVHDLYLLTETWLAWMVRDNHKTSLTNQYNRIRRSIYTKKTGSKTWHISSRSSIDTNGYLVTRMKDSCAECPELVVCRKARCIFLCRHMYKCFCYDYNNGHLCKHVHCIYSLYLTSHAVPPENEYLKTSTNQPETESRDADIDEDHIAGVTIIAKAEHSSHTTGLNEHIYIHFILDQCDFTLRSWIQNNTLLFLHQKRKQAFHLSYN